MLTKEQLEAAVASGVVTPEQARRLTELQVTESSAAEAAIDPNEENFRFVRGFNDIFLTIGVALITGALISFAGTLNGPAPRVTLMFVALAAFWGLSEVLVRGMRTVLPGIVLATLFTLTGAHATATVVALASNAGEIPFSFYQYIWPNDSAMSATFAYAVAFAGLYYARFRLPFALALIAVALIFLVARMAGSLPPSLIFFLCGLATFAAALVYDASDRDRVTRFTDCAFWLHLVAAPLIVHPAVSAIGSAGGQTGSRALLVLLTILALGLVALLIDRRAILVASLTYFSAAVFQIVAEGADRQGSLMITLALVGLFVLVLGVFWHPIRRAVLVPFAESPFIKSLPPIKT